MSLIYAPFFNPIQTWDTRTVVNEYPVSILRSGAGSVDRATIINLSGDVFACAYRLNVNTSPQSYIAIVTVNSDGTGTLSAETAVWPNMYNFRIERISSTRFIRYTHSVYTNEFTLAVFQYNGSTLTQVGNDLTITITGGQSDSFRLLPLSERHGLIVYQKITTTQYAQARAYYTSSGYTSWSVGGSTPLYSNLWLTPTNGIAITTTRGIFAMPDNVSGGGDPHTGVFWDIRTDGGTGITDSIYSSALFFNDDVDPPGYSVVVSPPTVGFISKRANMTTDIVSSVADYGTNSFSTPKPKVNNKPLHTYDSYVIGATNVQVAPIGVIATVSQDGGVSNGCDLMLWKVDGSGYLTPYLKQTVFDSQTYNHGDPSQEYSTTTTEDKQKIVTLMSSHLKTNYNTQYLTLGVVTM